MDSRALPLLGSPVEPQDAPEMNSWTLARVQGANVTSPGSEMSSQRGSGGAPEWAFLPEASSRSAPPSPPPPAGPGIGFGAGSASKAIFSGGRRGLSSTLSSHFLEARALLCAGLLPRGSRPEAGVTEGALHKGAAAGSSVGPRAPGGQGEGAV